jgi:hypothetical protein
MDRTDLVTRLLKRLRLRSAEPEAEPRGSAQAEPSESAGETDESQGLRPWRPQPTGSALERLRLGNRASRDD